MVGTKRTITVSTFVAIALASAPTMRAQNQARGHADLNGYEETPTLSSPASGTLDVRISNDGTSLDYTLTYSGLATNARFAHIHLGRTAIAGGIMAFLCTNETAPAGVPTPPACPLREGTVTGTLTSANVLALLTPNNQGLNANDFEAFIAALRSEAAYGNVHSTTFPAGEIRGQVTFPGNSGTTTGGNSNNGNSSNTNTTTTNTNTTTGNNNNP